MSGPVGPQEKQGIWVISIIGVSLHKLRDDAHLAAISPDGSQIAYVDANTKDLWVMNADGSQAKSILKPENGYQLFHPLWFPNGRRILYVKFSQNNGKANVIMESRKPDGSDPVVLLSNPNMRGNAWAGPGRLVITADEEAPRQKDRNLWEVFYDPDTGERKGEIRRLTDWAGFQFADLDFTNDGKEFLFQNVHAQSDVYVGELKDAGNALSAPQRLTLDEKFDWPTGWSADSKAVLFYSDLGGNFDVYRQAVGERNVDALTSGPDDKWAPQPTSDGKWILYISWPKATNSSDLPPGKLMRVPTSGGPAEFVADVKGHPFVGNTDGGFPSFRCPAHAAGDCVLAEEADRNQIAFTAIDPQQGRKAEVAKFSGDPDFLAWALSPDGSQIAVTTFAYKAADIQILPVKGGTPRKYSTLPFNELSAVVWTPDGRGLFLSSASSRGSSIVRYDFDKQPKLLWKSVFDVNELTPSPDGHYLALGPEVDDSNAWLISNFPAK